MPAAPFRFTSLGRIDLQHESRGSVATLLAQPKRLALLAYLLIAHPGGFASRDALLAMFWPDSDESRARASLRQALQFLRRTLGETAVVARGEDAVGIDPAVVGHDLGDLRAGLATGDAPAVVAAYTGELLPGLLVDDAPAFEQWLAAERETLRRLVLQQALVASAAATDARQALDLATRAVSIAPDDEPAARQLARLQLAAGNRAAAVQALDLLRRTLHDTLGVQPSDETLALERELRGPANTQPQAGTHGDRVSPSPAFSPTAEEAAAELPAHGPSSGQATPMKSARRRWLKPALAAAVLIVAIVLIWRAPAWSDRGAGATPTTGRANDQSVAVNTQPRVAVAPFDDRTGQSRFSTVGSMVADWLIGGVSRMEGVTVVPLTAMRSSARSLEAAPASGNGIPQDLLHRVAVDVGATVLVRGVVYYTDSTLHLQAQLTRIPSGELLQAAETVSVPADQVMQGLEQLRRRVVAALAPLGDSVSHLRHAATPPSYEAYRDYVRGLEQFVQGRTDEALQLFRAAARDDTSYTMPRIAAGITLLNLGRADEAAAQMAGLDARRSDLAPLERATFDMLRGMLDNDLMAVDRAVREQARLAPGTIGEYMVAETARRRGEPAEALRVLQALGPDRGELRGWRPYWRELTGVLHMLGDYAAEYRAAEEAMTRYGPEPVFLAYAVRARAAQGDSAAVITLIAQRERQATVSGSDAGVLWHIAANEMAARCTRTNSRDVACATPSGAGRWWRAQETEWLAAQVAASSAAGETASRRTQLRWRHARALALSGQWDAARDVLADLEPQGGDVVDSHGLQGAVAAARGDAAAETRALAQLAALQQRRSAAARAMAEGDVDYWTAVIAAQHRQSPRHADAAVAALQRAMSGWRGRDVTLASDPWFAGLHGHPSFAGLLTYAR
ncbi:MAG: hypothetical protein K2Y26_12720 [Gemmatimonadaceae bacterium]|nr:hypothetical protein [Gemmatimonadaceae bacterium]